MKNLNIKKADIDKIGGGKMGSIIVSYADLVKTIGEPQKLGSPDDKVQAEWGIKVAGRGLRIYDWKQYGTPLEEVKEWNIGGTPSDRQAIRVLSAFIALTTGQEVIVLN